MVRISNIKLLVTESENKLKKVIAKKLRVSISDIVDYKIHKMSIDARNKSDINYVYTIDASLKNEEDVLRKNKSVVKTPKKKYEYPEKGKEVLGNRPVVVGFGPSGMFLALALAENGYKPLVLERGKEIEERKKDIEQFFENGKLNEESNIQFGEGGAGTFSDGKLTTLTKDKFSRFKKVLEEFVIAGAKEDILYRAKPHIGTDYLEKVVVNIRKKIISLGGEIKFSSKVTDIKLENGKVCAVEVNGSENIESENIFLCLGHSARDTFEMIYKNNVEITPKDFAIGVRIEHKQNMINKSQYGKFESSLPAAEYKIVSHKGDRGCFSFCMCPGGEVVAASSEKETVVTNGMSKYDRNLENANAAILVGVKTEDYFKQSPLDGMYLQREIEKKAYLVGGENYNAPCQTVGSFLNKGENEIKDIIPTYKPGVKMTELKDVFPEYITETLKEALIDFGNKIKGFDYDYAVMTAPETRTSSPIRIVRDENFESSIKGIYPVGEGAGYAGGIMSAAVDGLKTAEIFIKKFKNV